MTNESPNLIAQVDVPTIPEAEWLESSVRTREYVDALEIPNGWRELRQITDPRVDGQRAFEHLNGRLVIVSVGLFDERWWLHVSLSRKKYLPSYDDLGDVKKIFVGGDRQAIQIFAREAKHVNLHPYTLHLWASLDPNGDGLPDFGRFGTI
jgi:hypothetical protein